MAPTSKLRISEDLALPTDFATKSAAILAQRRKGKSYTAAVLAEECVAAEVPFVILDPTGAHWGLRASADGKREGLPVYVFGGEHPSDPELALERTAGKVIADFVVDFPGYYVIDFKGFDSKEAERQFATDFAERLYRYKGQPGKDFVMHLFVDEADMFVPQQSPSGDKRMVGAFESIVRRGGLRGLGTTLISQRSAVVNKNVLEMIDILIILRTVGPNDREAIRKYVVANGTPDEVTAVMGSIASLALGEAWFYEPGAEPSLLERIRIRERSTFNSSATPKAGEKRVEPKKLADVELEALRDRMAATIEKKKAEDPTELRKRIRELEAELRKRPTETVEKEKIVQVEVPAVPVDVLDLLAKLVDAAGDVHSAVLSLDEQGIALGFMVEKLRKIEDWANARGAGSGTPRAATRGRTGPSSGSTTVGVRTPRPAKPASSSSTSSEGPKQEVGPLPKGERAVLTAIAQHPDGCTREQITILTGYKRSTRDAYIQRLREKELVDVRDRVHATDAGIEALGDDFEPLPTGAALREHWLGRLPAGEAAVLRVLIDAWPERGCGRDEITDATGYKRSTRDAYIQRLRTRELVDVEGGLVFASDVLFEEGG